MEASERHIAEGLLFTDLYAFTMAQLYFRAGMHDTPAQFDYFFRESPDYGSHQAGYCVFAGLGDLLDHLEQTEVRPDELELLRNLRTSSGEPLFGEDFLGWLRETGGLGAITVRSVAEGRVVHPGEPITVVRGPLAIVQLLESVLLNTLNYATLVATKAARLKQAAGGATVVDFGMRRGHGRGVNAGSRAALIGGADASSNTGTSMLLGLSPTGTHAHSMVQAFIARGGTELEAFRAYSEVYPHDCLLLVDTVDTLESGLPNAIRVFEELRRRGCEPRGIRLDSGDLAYLATACAAELDAAGFPQTKIVLSNKLDELTIWQIRSQILTEAAQRGSDAESVLARLSYGVGTRLIVSEGAPALDGVFKLVALAGATGWEPAIKLSDSPAKTINPGLKGLYRIYDERGRATADLVTLEDEQPDASSALTLYHPSEPEVTRSLQPDGVSRIEPLLEERWKDGTRSSPQEDIATLRERRRDDEAALDPGVLRLLNPHLYHVSISQSLWRLKQDLTERTRDDQQSW